MVTMRRPGPRDVGGILDDTFSLYRNNFSLFAGISAIIGAPEAVLSLIATSAAPQIHQSQPGVFATPNASSTFAALGAIFAVIGIFNVFFYPALAGALVRAVEATFTGKQVTVLGAYRALGWRGYWRVLLTIGVVGSILTVLSITFLLIPLAVFWAGRWALVIPAIVVENIGMGAGLRRSWWLVKGSFWRVLGIALLLFIIPGIVAYLIGSVVSGVLALLGLSGIYITTGVNGIIGIMTQPIAWIGLTLLYVDQRVRKEGFDLELMTQQLTDIPAE